MKLRINDIDVTQLAAAVTTNGSEKECARTLSANIVQSPTDSNIPAVPMNAGDMVAFEADEQSFNGIITSVQRSTASSTITITAKDCEQDSPENKEYDSRGGCGSISDCERNERRRTCAYGVHL